MQERGGVTMNLAEVLIRCKTIEEHIGPLMLRPTKVVKTQPGDRPTERLAASRTSVALVQACSPCDAKVRFDGGVRSATDKGGLAIPCLEGAGRHHLEGGLRHVPAVAGLAHSQAPPISSMGEPGKRSSHT
jgi:hypothetical protein